MLWHAFTCAKDAGAEVWDFALEIATLYESGLTISDLRWLVAKGFAEHGQESSVYGGAHRSIQPGVGYFFGPTTCVVLTPGGFAFAEQFLKTTVASSPHARSVELAELVSDPPAAPELNGSTTAEMKPSWNVVRRELCYDCLIVKRYRVPARIQEVILCTFEEDGWPEHIDDPLPGSGEIDPQTRLHDAIHRLNGHQTHRLLRFSGNGNGTGISWERRPPILAGSADGLWAAKA